jgi:hypothetical protein
MRRLGEASAPPPPVATGEPRRPVRPAAPEPESGGPAATVIPITAAASADPKPARRGAKKGVEPAAPPTAEPGGKEPAAAPPAVPAAPAVGLDLAAIETIWPALVERVRKDAGPRRHALFRACRPIAVEGARVVLEVPANLPFHLAQLIEDRELDGILGRIAGALLGGAVTVAYRPGDGEEQAGMFDAPLRAPDKDLLGEGDEPPADPEAVVTEIFGGEVVSKPKPKPKK